MKIHNTLTKRTEDFKPLHDKTVHMYSCGPTVYDHAHIGNLVSFITADTLRRVLLSSGYRVKHVMNFTDVDDKTIARSRQQYPDSEASEALRELGQHYGQIFISDMQAIGNSTTDVQFIKATEHIEAMQSLIRQLVQDGFAYIAEDGVYFSIEAYQKSGKHYGQLVKVNARNTSHQRIANDEYDKDNVHDFALWKTRKGDEPAWEFEIDGHDLLGRPGWHIECSAISATTLGQPFDIHTDGVDLKFPHHENEIAQSTAGHDNPLLAKYFVHNEHMLVDGHKMSKSLNNFYTLRDVIERGYEPLAFRLMALQGGYRKQSNFTWEGLDAAQNRLSDLRAMADMLWQPLAKRGQTKRYDAAQKILTALQDDLDTPQALKILSSIAADINEQSIHTDEVGKMKDFLGFLDEVLGLELSDRPDINKDQKHLIAEREQARRLKHWEKSDQIRQDLEQAGIGLRDTPLGTIWYRLAAVD